MSLHEEFYSLRERVWSAFETLVRTGCDFLGDFPIQVGEFKVRNSIVPDVEEITIWGILADSNYRLHEGKDLNVGARKIKVICKNTWPNQNEKEIIREVEPYILDLQTLSTYISGGYAVYADQIKSSNERSKSEI
jgi:hypothetical protein